MADFAEILVLAALPRDHGHVYIGLRLDRPGQLVRIVGPPGDFSVSPDEALLDAGRLPQPLDVVRVGLRQRVPEELQPENRLVDRSLRWLLLREPSTSDLQRLFECALQGSAALQAIDRSAACSEPRQSIWLLEPSALKFCVHETADADWLECSVRADFGVSRRMISIADERCQERLGTAGCGTHDPDEVGYPRDSRTLLVVVIGDYEDEGEELEPFVVAVLQDLESLGPAMPDTRKVIRPGECHRGLESENAAPAPARPRSNAVKWSDECTRELCRLWEGGATVAQLATRFGRRHLAILARLWRLGYDPTQERFADSQPPDQSPDEEASFSSWRLEIDLSALPDASECLCATPVVARARRSHPRAYAPWTAKEDAELLRLAGEGAEHEEISRVLKRQVSAVTGRLRHLKEAPEPRSIEDDHRSDASLTDDGRIGVTAAERLSARLGRGVRDEQLLRFSRRLEPHQRDVLAMRFGGIDRHEPAPIRAVAEALALSEERVGEIEGRVLDALRGYLDGWGWALGELAGEDRTH